MKPQPFVGWLPYRHVEPHWPPTDVADLCRLAGCRVEACEWAAEYGSDYERAWRECPRGGWLFRLAGVFIEQAPEPLRSEAELGFAKLLFPPQDWQSRTPRVNDREHMDDSKVRRLIDGIALLRACGLGTATQP